MPVSIFTSSPQHLSLKFLPERIRITGLELLHSPGLPGVLEANSDYLGAHFPFLKTLRLWGRTGECAATDLNILDAPRIQALALHNVTLADWSAPFVGRLTSLALTYDPSGPTRGLEDEYTLSSILDLIGRMTTLTSLKLGGLLDPSHLPNRSVCARLRQVRLPQLTQLEVWGESEASDRLLEHLYLPAVESVTVQGSILRYHDEKKQRIIFPSMLSKCLTRARWPPSTDATFELGDAVKIIARSRDSEKQPTAIPITRCLVTVSPKSASLDLAATFPQQVMPLLQGLTTLRLDMQHHLSSQYAEHTLVPFWLDVSRLRALVTIELNGRMCGSFIDLLLALVPSLANRDAVYQMPTAGRMVHEPFPALRALTLRKLQLAHMKHGRSVFEHLAAFLDCRSEQRRPVDVTVGDCSLPELTQEMVELSGIRILPSVDA